MQYRDPKKNFKEGHLDGVAVTETQAYLWQAENGKD
jgi:hypothetical protein